MNFNQSADTLLDLDGVIIDQIGGYWVKFEVRQVSKLTEARPRGIRYSLTLHDKYGIPIMDFDNAHAINKSKKINIKRLLIISTAILAIKVLIINLLAPTNY